MNTKNRVLGCFCGALIGIQASAEYGDECGNGAYSALEKSLRACIRFYQQGKIKGEACLIDYFISENQGKASFSELDALSAAVVLGMAFEKESAFKWTLSLCEKWDIKDSKDRMAFAMMAGILSGITRGEKFKQSINWAMGFFYETGDDEELTELMKLVVALYESRKDLDTTIKFISDDIVPYKAFGASLVVALRMREDILRAVDCSYSNSEAGKFASIPTGAMIGAFMGYDSIWQFLDYEGEYIECNMEMAVDLYNIIYNNAILPFDKYAPL
ncbi:MAG: hypothetical protein JJE29_01035 [Peptostreptococcaceae bacterium]|nr:hypothetical protein [Peptostreptococcaceae bacterium]